MDAAPLPPAGPVLEVRDAGVDRGPATLLNGVSLRLQGGDFVALLGPSGCGKSTLLKTLSGVLRPSRGEVALRGSVFAGGERPPGSVGYVPQDDIVHTALRVRAALDYAAQLRLPAGIPAASRKGRVDSVLKLLSLMEHQGKRVRQLSGGQRKRVSVGVELLTDPRLLLMDEPTSGLDPALEAHLMLALRRLTTHERITVVSTHAMASLDVCDLAVFLAKGRLVFAGPPKEALPHFGVTDLAAVFRRLAAEPVSVFTAAWERSPWRPKSLLPRTLPVAHECRKVPTSPP